MDTAVGSEFSLRHPGQDRYTYRTFHAPSDLPSVACVVLLDTTTETDEGRNVGIVPRHFAAEVVRKLNAHDSLLEAAAKARKLLAEMANTGQVPDVDTWADTQQALAAAIGVATGPDLTAPLENLTRGRTVRVIDEGKVFAIHERKQERGRLYVRGVDTIWYDFSLVERTNP